MGGPCDGASRNPARSSGPVAGAAVAAGAAHVLRGPAKAQEAGAAEGTPLDRAG
jgi:aquaporin Z